MPETKPDKNGENSESSNGKPNPEENNKSDKSQDSERRPIGSDQRGPWTFLPLDLESKIIDLTGPIQLKAKSIRQEDPVNWKPYAKKAIISQEEAEFLEAFQAAQSKEDRDDLLQRFQEQAFETFRNIVQKVTLEADLKKILVVIDDMIWEDEGRLKGYSLEKTKPWNDFMHLLDCTNTFIRNIAARIISIMISWSNQKPRTEEMKKYLVWLKNELKPNNEYLQSVTRCLQLLLRTNDYRKTFMTLNGIFQIVKLLSLKLHPQEQYQLSFCLWVTSLNPELAEKMNRAGTIPVLAEILKSSPIESLKLPRIVTATLRNLLERPKEPGVQRHNALVMQQCKLVNYFETIDQKVRSSKDPEFEDDYEYVKEILTSYVTQMTSFDEYYYEIKSRRLEWSMVHNSRKFWIDNAEKLNFNNYELLKILISILETSQDSVMLCIAAHDLGEYMKVYNKGKLKVEELGGKTALVRLLGHAHPKVRYHVLKTLQIIMLNNYQLFNEFFEMPNVSMQFSSTNVDDMAASNVGQI